MSNSRPLDEARLVEIERRCAAAQNEGEAQGYRNFCAHKVAREDTPGLIAEVRQLKREVREWICENCRTVYPGPPQKGVMCVMCPRCDEATTMPYSVFERLEVERERDNALKELRKLKEKLPRPII